MKQHFKNRRKYSALHHPLPWATRCLGPSIFFSNEKKKYFSPYAYYFIFKSNLLNLNFVEKNSYFILFFWKVIFSMRKVHFRIFGFIETKRLNIDSFTNENWKISLSVIGVKFSGGKKKKLVVNKELWIISYNNAKARALGHLENVNMFCDNLQQAMAQLGKNYSVSNIYNLIVKSSPFFCQNKKVQII